MAKLFLPILILACLLLGFTESFLSYRDSQYVRSVASRVVQEANAADAQAKVIALRDYLRRHVRYQEAATEGRPFLRDSAADTLRSGKGYCGEVSRAFIVMADTVGIRAQRINLYGKAQHVVAEAELAPGNRVIVDCQNPPQIADLEPLDQVIQRPEYDDYYTLNLRRLHLNWLVTRVKLEMGPLTYWVERPHAINASLWFLLAAAMLGLKGLRLLARAYLKWRGWVHISTIPAVQPEAESHVDAVKTVEKLKTA
ncbi:MAG: transglutaminase-like domain-containing protein [Blastocatellia bacterium]